MATIPPSYRRDTVLRVAKHEAGHYIVARVLGFKTGEISLTMLDMNGGHSASSVIVLAQPLACDPSIMDYLERRVSVLYAGSIAEALNNGVVDNDAALKTARELGGVRDWDKARELVQLLRNLRYPDVTTEDEIQAGLTELDLKVWTRATEIIVQEHELIEGIAGRLAQDTKFLHRKVTLTEADLAAMTALQQRFG